MVYPQWYAGFLLYRICELVWNCVSCTERSGDLLTGSGEISQFDIFKADRVLYHVDSTIRETGNRVDDGLYRVFVNTEVKDGTTVSEYMECFLKKEVNNSKFPAFTKRMNALKHEERGLNAVCEVMEKYEQKAVEEGLSLFEKAITMLASGKSPSEVVLTGVPQNIVDRASRAMKPKLNK